MEKDYRGYVTQQGFDFEATAKKLGYKVQFGKILIGDGSLPDDQSPATATKLVHKIKEFSAVILKDAKNPGVFIAECTIPANDSLNGAGYTINEMGVELSGDGAGILYAYRRVSGDYKPVIESGEAKSFIYRLRFIPANAALINVTVDLSAAVASYDYVDSKVSSLVERNDTEMADRAYAAMSPVKNAQGSINVIGDSISQFVGASQFSKSWVSLFFDDIAKRDKSSDSEAVINFSILDKYGMACRGNWSLGQSGPLGQSLVLSEGASVEFNGQYEFVDVYFNRTPAAGKLRFLKDGELYKTIDCRGDYASDVLTFFSGKCPGNNGAHRILAIDGAVEITAITRLNQSTKRIHLNRMACSGYSSSDFISDARLASIATQGSFFQSASNWFIIAIGTNDIYNQQKAVTPDKYAENITKIAHRMLSGNNKVVLVVPPISDESIWPPVIAPHVSYADALRRVSRELDLPIVDLSLLDLHRDDMYGDGVHPNDAGHLAIRNEFNRQLGNIFSQRIDQASHQDGVWTPQLMGMGVSGQHTYKTAIGRYVRIGNMVIAQGVLVLQQVDPAMSGFVGVSLPFPTSSQDDFDQSGVIGIATNITTVSGDANFVMDCVPGLRIGLLRTNQPGAIYEDISAVGAGSRIAFSISYFIDQ
ncbi:hypothetical protein ELS78_21450 [Aeromonas veronii]|uniref:GDSL-type esterase/lipase family protein n=1 Tax=Aeromonas veronii TaxID=654 RepID=UPI000F8E7DAE|nr:GDSL-type esterase/lipase family protein [Aeromonas veronii]RUR51966.1 hypothetical protein ELS78_21450 [Aeromonas veronii]